MFNQSITVTPRRVWGAITLLGAIGSAIAWSTWEIRKDYIEDLKHQVETYEKSASWKLPETLDKIGKASSALSLQMAERTELEKLRKESAQLRDDNKRLEDQVQRLNQKAKETQATLDGLLLEATTFELEEGQTAALVKNSVFLGLRTKYSSGVSITLDNQSVDLNIGESTTYMIGNRRCMVTLVSLKPKLASFVNACQ